uniref:Uncharacterized protein n=1 Tax=Arundo donax TaxID=35708 RepID=A0A0A9CIQ6_ARUDO
MLTLFFLKVWILVKVCMQTIPRWLSVIFEKKLLS